MESVTDGGRPDRGGGEAVGGPTKPVKAWEAMVEPACSQNVFGQNASNVLVVTKGSITFRDQ
jgi:hypothetical protein